MTPFDDHPVTECAMRIVGAGTGLSESLDVAPVELHHDEVVCVVLRCLVTKVSYERIKDLDELRRVHTVRATFGSIIDQATAEKILKAQRKLIDEERGIQTIPGVE